MDLHVYHHFDVELWSRADRKLDRILAQLAGITRQEALLMADLTDLTAKVQATADTEQSAIVLLNGLKALLDAAGTDPAKLAALSAQLGTNADALAAAVVQDTPPTAPSAKKK